MYRVELYRVELFALLSTGEEYHEQLKKRYVVCQVCWSIRLDPESAFWSVII